MTRNSSKKVDGSWQRYEQTTDPRTAKRLSGSLQMFDTGWCTAGESTAEAQLNDGDFYVFYSHDEDGKDTIPRIAIRMEADEVSEVRGILPDQELEPAMIDIASEKLQGLPGGEAYNQRAADMKRLTTIDNLLAADPGAELTADEVVFLYGLERKIEGFGYEADPRILELQLKAATARTVELLDQVDAKSEVAERTRNQVRLDTIMDLARQDEAAELSDSDLCFAYGLDGPIRILDPYNSLVAQQLDDLRGERDRDRLMELMPEALERQYRSSSIGGYEAVAHSLGTEPVDISRLDNEFFDKLETWEKQGAYRYMLEHIIDRDTPFTLVMTPNIIASPEQIIKSARDFGERQPSETKVYDELYQQYTGEQLSGVVEPDVAVRFSLMPSVGNDEFGYATVNGQLMALQQLRNKDPQLDIRVPSVLEAVAYWQGLRARGDALNDQNVRARTHIPHFNLPPKPVESGMVVPNSVINDEGMPYLGVFVTKYRTDARVLVG